MTKVQQFLEQLGLSPTEARVYLAGLPGGSIGVQELAKRTGIQRTTIYHAVETLVQRGLAARTTHSGRQVFTMVQPEQLARHVDEQVAKLERQKQELRSLLPEFHKLDHSGHQLNVMQYEGAAGMKLVVEEALYCRTKHWDIIAPGKNFFSDFDRTYAEYFMHARQQRGIVTRSLWEKDPSRRLLTPKELQQRNPRFLPKAMQGKFASVIIMFDDAVAMISSVKQRTAIIIRSPEFHQTMGALFEGLWSQAERY